MSRLHIAGSTVKGSDQAYGVEVATNLISTTASLYDGAHFMGVSFWAKSVRNRSRRFASTWAT